MAYFRVDERVQEDLSFLASLPSEQFGDFCNIALEFVRRGPNEKLYTRAAGRVGVEPAVVERSIVALSRVLVDAANAKLDAFRLQTALSALPFGEESAKLLHEFAMANGAELHECARKREPSVPAYSHLDWRLDVEVASRTQHRQVRPTFLLRLDTESGGAGGAAASELLQSDYANLKRLQTVLEAATADMKAAHASRIARYIK